MDDTFRIREAGETDIGIVVQLAREIWPRTYKEILPEAQIEYMMALFYTPESLLNQMRNHHRFIIGYLADRPVAFASFGPLDEATVYKLHKIYIHQEVQGKQLGRKMINYIADVVRESSAKMIELNVNRNNNARWFYEKLGFSVVREEDIDIGNGFLMEDYVMTKHV